MTNAADIAENYIALWNETDAGRRKAMFAQGWADGATYIDPTRWCQRCRRASPASVSTC